MSTMARLLVVVKMLSVCLTITTAQVVIRGSSSPSPAPTSSPVSAKVYIHSSSPSPAPTSGPVSAKVYSSSPSPAPTSGPVSSKVNIHSSSPSAPTSGFVSPKVYQCSDGCSQKCIRLAEKSEDELSSCTLGCMEPCLRSLMDGVYKCTLDCTQSVSVLHSASNMDEGEGHMSRCYKSCKRKDF